jgi:hypothetical protein
MTMTSDTQRTDDEKEPSPWTQTRFVLSAGVVGLLVVFGVIIAFTGGSSPDKGARAQRPGPAPAPTSTLPAASATTSADDSVCGLPAGSQGIPTTGPDVAWVVRGILVTPSSPSVFGPGRSLNGVPTCFAHSPLGAVFALANISGALNAVNQQSAAKQLQTVHQVAAAGAGRSAAEALTTTPDPRPDTSTALSRVVGFKLVRYERTSAVVSLALRVAASNAGSLAQGTATLRWEHRDWKLVFAEDGEAYDATGSIEDLAGYVPWGGA